MELWNDTKAEERKRLDALQIADKLFTLIARMTAREPERLARLADELNTQPEMLCRGVKAVLHMIEGI